MLIDDLLDGLRDRLSVIDNLTITTNPAVTIVPRLAVVSDDEVTFNATMGRGSDDVAFLVTVYVSKSDSKAGLRQARNLFLSGHGNSSIRTALEESLGASDPLNDCMIRVDSGRTGIINSPAGDSWIAATITGLATIDGGV